MILSLFCVLQTASTPAGFAYIIISLKNREFNEYEKYFPTNIGFCMVFPSYFQDKTRHTSGLILFRIRRERNAVLVKNTTEKKDLLLQVPFSLFITVCCRSYCSMRCRRNYFRRSCRRFLQAAFRTPCRTSRQRRSTRRIRT